MASHTPGPWGLDLFSEYEDGTDCEVLDADSFPIASVEARPILNRWPEHFPKMGHWSDGVRDGRTQRKRPRAEYEANARLIAAAPDLLAALRAAGSELTCHRYDMACGDVFTENHFGHHSCGACEAWREAGAALAKAEGGPAAKPLEMRLTTHATVKE